MKHLLMKKAWDERVQSKVLATLDYAKALEEADKAINAAEAKADADYAAAIGDEE